MRKTFTDKEGVISFTVGDDKPLEITLHDVGWEYTWYERGTVEILLAGHPMPAKLRPGRYILHKECTEYDYFPEAEK